MPIKEMQGYRAIGDAHVCEICGKIVPLNDLHSLAVVYRMPGPGGTAYQCPNEQHYACSHEHAVLAVVACLTSHIELGPYANKQAEYEDEDLKVLKQRVSKYHNQKDYDTDPAVPVVK
jgi:hypothetical protein